MLSPLSSLQGSKLREPAALLGSVIRVSQWLTIYYGIYVIL